MKTSNMDYEKLYKEAIARMRKYTKDEYGCTRLKPEDIFPELAKSEDVMIKEKIIATIHLYYGEPLEDEAKEMIAWLEKQGENTHNKELSELLHKVICRFINDPNIPYTEREKVSMEIIPYVERLEKQGEQNPISLEDAAKLFLEKLSESPYNNKPITDAQVITKELINFLKDTNTYNPNAINEQKPAEWSEEDIIMKGEIINVLQKTGNYEKEINWLKHLKDRVQPQPKQEWKQENTEELSDFENVMMHIENSFFGQHAGLDPNDTDAIKKQANLLLELVPKQEWSEEDKNMLQSILDEYKSMTIEKRNWLKSLKERCTWKPSDGQMDALCYVTNFNYGGYKATLVSLYEQLKKLKE